MLSTVVPGRQTTAAFTMLLAGIPQGAPPRYTEPMLACAAFREEVRSDIRSESGTVLREERAGRNGLILMQGTRGDSGVLLSAWYDSLQIWRDAPEGRSMPDAEGLLGGRWRGTLMSDGRFRLGQTPFIPDEVAEIADLRGVMADFFPVLAPDPGRDASFRRIGQEEGGLTRYGWTVKFRADTSGAVDDTLVVPMGRQFQEEGVVSWDHLRGPVRWERTITVTGRIEARGAIRRGMRSTVIQRVRVERIENRSCA